MKGVPLSLPGGLAQKDPGTRQLATLAQPAAAPPTAEQLPTAAATSSAAVARRHYHPISGKLTC